MDAIYDCHLHTEFSADSETPVRDQLEKAISLWNERDLYYRSS